MASESVILPAESIADIRRMLLIGLHAYGECGRIRTEIDAVSKLGTKAEKILRPIDLTANYETANFAEALHWLEFADPVESKE